MEQALEYFSIFGGYEGKIDITQSPLFLIKEHLLKNYKKLNYEISDITQNDTIYHAVLSGIALGDGRTHSAYKRARVSESEGDEAVTFLIENGFLLKEEALESAQTQLHRISDKLRFTSPFLHFYFACIAPLYQGIREGDYSEVEKRFEAKKEEFILHTFKALAREVLKSRFDEKLSMRSYWDANNSIDIYAKTSEGKIILGDIKYANAKAKKSMLSELTQKAQAANIEANMLVLFSKNGFSSELKKMKNEHLMLLSLKNFKSLVE